MKSNNINGFLLANYVSKGSNFSIIRKTIKGYHALHWHNYFEIEYVIKGSGKEIINGKEYEIKLGLFYFLLPTDYHEVYLDSDVEIINITFDYPMLSSNLSQDICMANEDFVFVLSGEDHSKMLCLLNMMIYDFNHHDKYYEVNIHNLLQTILITAIRNSQTFLTSETKKVDNRIVLPALNYINLHFKENPRLEQVAKAVFCSPAYFSKIFKQSTGKTFYEYITSMKISFAKKLILTYQYSMIDVCFLSGFTSVNNFMRVFKQQVQMSPSAFKKENKRKTI